MWNQGCCQNNSNMGMMNMQGSGCGCMHKAQETCKMEKICFEPECKCTMKPVMQEPKHCCGC